MTTKPLREIEGKRAFSAKRFFFQWEWLLVLVLAAIFIMNTSLSSNFASFGSLMSAISDFMDKAILVFPMMMVIMLGDIDVSVGSTMALTATVMGVCFQSGIPMGLCIVIGLLLGTLCGFINGYLISRFKELSAVIVTISTMIIFRGVATAILRDQAAGGFPKWFTQISWGKLGGIPFTFLFFVVEAAFFIVLIHKSKFGRRLYACGNSMQASRYSGIETKNVKLAVFTAMGFFAAIAAVFLMSKMSSARPNIATNYELDVIAMVVLGGVSTAGGKGRVPGVILSMFIICFLRYGLGLVNIQSEMVMIILGGLLILSVSAPSLKTLFRQKNLVSAKTKETT